MSEFEIPPPPKGGAGALLPPDAGRDRPLFIVAAILVFLACIAALGARGAWQQSQRWTEDLQTSLTVQVRPVEGGSASEDAQRAADIAAAMDGVANATARDRAHAERLIAPWLGTENIPDDLPLPLIVEIRLEPGIEAPLDALREAFDEAGINASVDDHSRWADAVRGAATRSQTLALALLALLAGAAAAVVAFASRASLAARVDVIDALHLCGAEDRYIAILFQRRFFMLGLKSGAVGAIIAVIVSLLVGTGSQAADASFFLPSWENNPFEFLLLAIAPLLAGATAALSARLAVITDLGRRW
ncbi:MAG: hypothetical protein GYB36_00560 [Alphaproteobacteria bacterium]|nr:hypothetical protein [Alphaproteobacteria bacterium]